MRALNDWLSPVVVKEVRQGLKAKTFVAVFLITQAAMVTSVLFAMLPSNSSNVWEVSSILYWGTAISLLLVVMPLRGSTALTTELKSKTFELVLLTRLTAFRIVAGKFSSLMVQSALVTSTILPYAVLRYFIGGVDVVLELVILVCIFAGCGLLTAAMVFASTFSAALLRWPAVLLSFFPLLLIGPAIDEFFGYGARASQILEELTSTILPILFIVVFLILFLLEFAAGRFAPPAENHALRKRALGLLLLLICFLAVLFDLQGIAAAVVASVLLLVAVDANCEEVTEIPVVYGAFVRFGLVGRLAGWLFYPGWVSGARYSILLVVGIAVLHGLVDSSQPNDLLVFASSSLVFLLFPLAMAKLFKTRGRRVWIWYLVFLGLNALGAIVIATLDEVRILDDDLMMLLPMGSLLAGGVREMDSDMEIPAMGFAICTTLLSMVILYVRGWEPSQTVRQLERVALVRSMEARAVEERQDAVAEPN